MPLNKETKPTLHTNVLRLLCVVVEKTNSLIFLTLHLFSDFKKCTFMVLILYDT